MLLFLIILFVVFAANWEKIIRKSFSIAMNIVHRYEFAKREAYKFLYKNNLL